MKGERLLYFTPAEFLIMLELAGEGDCSLLSCGEAPDDGELTRALASLFQRGLLRREADGFAPTGAGELFRSLRRAPVAVVITGMGPGGDRAICYGAEDGLWLVELADVIVSRQYRVRRLGEGELESWLWDTGLLDPPVLTDEDAGELRSLFADELEEPRGRPVLLLERYRNGGDLLSSWEVRMGKGQKLICRGGPGGVENEIYTVEALSRMLTDCFGRE